MDVAQWGKLVQNRKTEEFVYFLILRNINDKEI